VSFKLFFVYGVRDAKMLLKGLFKVIHVIISLGRSLRCGPDSYVIYCKSFRRLIMQRLSNAEDLGIKIYLGRMIVTH
jgi:hypothetical protein